MFQSAYYTRLVIDIDHDKNNILFKRIYFED